MPDDPPLDFFLALCSLASGASGRRAQLQRDIERGYLDARAALPARTDPRPIHAAIPGGMLDALCIAGALGRDTAALDHHYTRAMPAALARQLCAAGVPEEALFSARLSLRRMPRLARALEGLFARVAAAGLPCEPTLGASTPARLLEARPSLAALYAGCHFGRSMPMLYAAPGDVSSRPGAAARDSAPEARALRDEGLEAWIDARYAGPLAHELAHLQPLDDAAAARIPAPGNLHEALAAWLGSEAFPEQLWPRPRSDGDPGGLDALPGGAFFASVGAWIARALGEAGAIRAQAGALDLDDALGAAAPALRLYGWLPHLESGAPHLLADTFSPARWWKLVDLHRDLHLARDFEEACLRPLLEAPPPALGAKLVAHWNRALDELDWSALPAWRDTPGLEDEKLALRACRALAVRAVRQGGSFRAERAEPPAWPEPATAALEPARASRPAGTHAGILGDGPLRLDVRACLLRAAWSTPDAVGAPASHPVPPALCAAYARAGFDQVRGTPDGLPALPSSK